MGIWCSTKPCYRPRRLQLLPTHDLSSMHAPGRAWFLDDGVKECSNVWRPDRLAPQCQCRKRSRVSAALFQGRRQRGKCCGRDGRGCGDVPAKAESMQMQRRTVLSLV